MPLAEARKLVQSFLVQQLQSNSTPVPCARAAAGLLVDLFKKGTWADASAANAIADAVLSHSDAKVAAAGTHFLLGNFKMASKLVNVEEEAEKQKSKKQLEEEELEGEVKQVDVCDFRAMDFLHDPQSLSEKQFARLNGLSFEARVLHCQLIARLIGRHQLLLLNYYPYLLKYMRPSHAMVTRVLAALTEACHEMVPPEDLQPVVKHMIENFIGDHCRPEVIALGLNTMRRICEKCPLALTSEQLS